MLKTEILPAVNQFAYGQVESPLRLGPVHQGPARARWASNENVALSEIADKDGIYGSIKDFLGKGR